MSQKLNTDNEEMQDMGYSHYWYKPKELEADRFKLFADDVRKIICRVSEEGWNGKNIVIRGGNGEGKPEITDEIISFNGDTDNGLDSERFYISRIEKDDRTKTDKFINGDKDGYFKSCKTNLEPYDLVVVASLIAFKYRFGDQVKVKFAFGKLEDIKDELLLAEDVIGPFSSCFIESLIKKND